jgi:hypothetical protein
VLETRLSAEHKPRVKVGALPMSRRGLSTASQIASSKQLELHSRLQCGSAAHCQSTSGVCAAGVPVVVAAAAAAAAVVGNSCVSCVGRVGRCVVTGAVRAVAWVCAGALRTGTGGLDGASTRGLDLRHQAQWRGVAPAARGQHRYGQVRPHVHTHTHTHII